MKKLIWTVLVLGALGGGAYYYKVRTGVVEPSVMTQAVSRGDIVDSVGATGTLEAVETVDVGTQVSGVVQELFADFNSIVKKGQVIAKLDPQLIQTQIEQQRANVIRAEADLERLKVSLADALQKLDRAKQMSSRQLIPQTELETAEVNVKAAEAQLKSSEAGLTQARAQLNNQKVNLAYTTITAPIDGIVISRNVDQGQTVASSMNAPTLYVLAADLAKMQVLANIDEADVGRMRPGQHVTFRVDAFPTEQFTGTVTQVRLQPAVVQNVVTYSTVITVPNPELKLKPGMTANVNIEIARRSNVLRVPNAATRFRPTPEMFAVLKQPVPPELERGGRAGAGRGQRGEGARGGSQPAGGAPGANAAATPPSTQPSPAAGGQAPAQSVERDRGSQAQQVRAGQGESGGGGPGERASAGRGGFDPDMTPEERRKRLEERMANMTPEERERLQARMREGGRGFGGGDRGRDDQGGGRGMAQGSTQAGGGRAGIPGVGNRMGANGARGNNQARNTAPEATTIDSLFGPLPVVESRGTVWQYDNKQLKMVRLRLGVTDQTFSEVLNPDDIREGTEVVVNMTTGLETRTQQGQNPQGNPLMGPQRGGPGRGGGGGGGGGRGRG